MNIGFRRMVNLGQGKGAEEGIWLNAGYYELLHFILG